MAQYAASFHLDTLGPLRVRRGAQVVDLGPAKQRAVFALLALNAGAEVSTAELIEAVWGESSPASARQLVHTYVARLRSVLEPDVRPRRRLDVIGSTGAGYVLLIDPDNIDAKRFEHMLGQAQRCLGQGQKQHAFYLLSEAIRLWRDPTLAELGALLAAGEQVELLRQRWGDAAQEYVNVGLELGRAVTVLPVAKQLALAEPMHEDIQAHYVLALGQTGQRAAAIEHFGQVRARLRRELGVAPGRQLGDAHRRVLEGAPGRTPDVADPPAPAAVWTPWRGPGPGPGPLVRSEVELEALVSVLADQRLLTVSGPPGCGKSAAALQTATRLRDAYAGGVAVVECSDLEEPRQLTERLLALFDADPQRADLARTLGDQQILLVFDDVEHCIEACATVIDWLIRSCRRVSAIVTSREPLGRAYETTRRLLPLTLPDEPGYHAFIDSQAVQLFVRRAEQVRSDFRLGPDNAEAVVTICRRLDGLPLAIELAAACLATGPLEEVLRRTGDPLYEICPPRRGKPAHQRTLRSTLRRSLDSLDDRERWCFLRLGRLPRNFSLDQAKEACGTPPWGRLEVRAVLSKLVEKSLLYTSEDGYGMLRLTHRFAADFGRTDGAVAVGEPV
jgi:predicted ATPase/DNA-binding SARP family transcriptional activator